MRYYDSPDELVYSLMMQNLAGGGAGTWMTLALMVAFLGVIFYKREFVTSWVLFRMATIMFALSMVLPTFVMGVTMPIAQLSLGSNASFETVIIRGLAGCVGPASLAISLLCLFSSVMPRRTALLPQPVPQKHPLDD